MELILGFVLGIIGGVISSFAFLWLTSSRRRPLLATIQNPRLTLRLRFQTPERQIATVIERLFAAWCAKDVSSYLSCWTDDCVRVQGATSNVTMDKAAIEAKFKASCTKYAVISVPTLVIEEIGIAPDGAAATVFVYYRFDLKRADDLPVIEHSREVYSFRRTDGMWLIAANLDHFTEIAPLGANVQ